MARVVLDTNVLRAALWSSSGASFRLVDSLPRADVTPCFRCRSTSSIRKCSRVRSNCRRMWMRRGSWGFLRRFAALAEPREIHFLWRPWLHDRDDDMVLELAVNGSATHLVTFNKPDFAGVEAAFGIRVVTPAEFLASLPPKP